MRPDASTKIRKATPKAGPNPVIIGAVVAAIVIVAVIVAIVLGSKGKSGGTAAGSSVPVGVVGGTGGGILVNASTAKPNAPTLDLYEDFQCPSCARLEEAIGAQVTSMAKAGQIKLVVHTLRVLDDNLKNDSSARSATAAACAADAGKYLPFHAAVFAAQPVKEGEGYTDAQITDFAKQAGITGPALTTWQQCTNSGQHDQYVLDVQQASDKAGVTGTPTLKLNGKDITKSLEAPGGPGAALDAAVKAATS
jgi:protein-disulfide isomerase